MGDFMTSGFDDGRPIFQQIAEMIEDDILTGTYQEDDKIYSVAQLVSTFQINPATAVKGISLLVNEEILYKKRGLGMFVAKNAKNIIMNKRRDRFLNELIFQFLDEAEKIGLTDEDVIEMIRLRKRS